MWGETSERRRGTQAASGLGRDRDKRTRGTQTDNGEREDAYADVTQMTEAAAYGEKRKIARGCCRKIVRGTDSSERREKRDE